MPSGVDMWMGMSFEVMQKVANIYVDKVTNCHFNSANLQLSICANQPV